MQPGHHAHPDHDAPFDEPRGSGIARIGIGGPVGSGKTALIEALIPMLLAAGHRPVVVTNDIFTMEDAQHVQATLAGMLDPERVVGVETGSCPHTAVRDDPTMNLAAGEELLERFPDIDTLVYESGGDNLTLTFSPALADVFVFVLDTSEGEKMPRKRGPGITESDILVINKIDIAHLVGADMAVMTSDAHRMRGSLPVITQSLVDTPDAPAVAGWVRSLL